MSTTLRWIVSTSASAFHAAEQIIRGRPIADASLATALTEAATQLAEAIQAAAVPAELFWRHAAALAAGIHGNRELAEVLLKKIHGPSARQPARIDLLAGAISALENAYDQAAPRGNDELELRSGPLREQWEARGPGLLAQIGRLTETELIVPAADVLLVHPIQGAGGTAHPQYNTVRFEAVLTNVHASLPEVMRLGWLLAQLNNDLPIHQGDLARDRAEEVGALALIPAALTAAETVELAGYDSATLAMALAAWKAGDDAVARLTGTIDQWWQVYGETRPRWSVALAALDRMLAESSGVDDAAKQPE